MWCVRAEVTLVFTDSLLSRWKSSLLYSHLRCVAQIQWLRVNKMHYYFRHTYESNYVVCVFVWHLKSESQGVGQRGLSLSCRWLVMSKGFVLLSWPPLQDHHLAKQEMTLLPSFLFRQGTGMSPGNPSPPARTLLPDKRLSFPVLVALGWGEEK